MDSTGRVLGHGVLGSLRHVLIGPGAPRPAPTHRRGPLRGYGTPLGLFALCGLALAAYAYLSERQNVPAPFSALIAVGSVLPAAVAVRRPLLAWRLAYPLTFLGAIGMSPTEPWPWNPVQIFGFLGVLATVAVREDTGVVAWVTALSTAPILLLGPSENTPPVLLLIAAIALVGERWGRQGQRRRELAEQTELNERERAKRAVLEERTRIAREMHDVVAHHMSMIAVRAETAPYRLPDLAVPARDELDAIAVAARAALGDMRRLLSVLRSDAESAPRTPQPGLDDLPELVRDAQRAGVPVALDSRQTAQVPDAVGLAVYRIVQEALANAARHAPGRPVAVRLHGAGDLLHVSVHNAGPVTVAPDPPVPDDGTGTGSGHGLVGMRERVTLLGGVLGAGPDPDGGYTVTASLPYDRRSDE